MTVKAFQSCKEITIYYLFIYSCQGPPFPAWTQTSTTWTQFTSNSKCTIVLESVSSKHGIKYQELRIENWCSYDNSMLEVWHACTTAAMSMVYWPNSRRGAMLHDPPPGQVYPGANFWALVFKHQITPRIQDPENNSIPFLYIPAMWYATAGKKLIEVLWTWHAYSCPMQTNTITSRFCPTSFVK